MTFVFSLCEIGIWSVGFYTLLRTFRISAPALLSSGALCEHKAVMFGSLSSFPDSHHRDHSGGLIRRKTEGLPLEILMGWGRAVGSFLCF